MTVCTLRAEKQLVHTGEGLISQRNETVLQRHHCFHVEAILAAAQLQLLSHCVHESTFPQLYSVAKAVLGNLHSVGLVGLDLAVGVISALFEEQLAARQSQCFSLWKHRSLLHSFCSSL